MRGTGAAILQMTIAATSLFVTGALVGEPARIWLWGLAWAMVATLAIGIAGLLALAANPRAYEVDDWLDPGSTRRRPPRS
jgi:hypothetical protein